MIQFNNNLYSQKSVLHNVSLNKQPLKAEALAFFYRLSKLIVLSLCYTFMCPTPTLAHQINIDLTGISYHIGASSKNPAYIYSPRGIDKYGVFVFNPGIGFGWDFRPIQRENRFSGITKAIYFRDCDDRGFFMLGAGGRYRCFFSKSFSGDISAMATVSAGQQWHTNTYQYSILPLVLLGVNYHFKNEMMIGMNFTVAPRNTSFDATGGFWILFSTLQLSFPIIGGQQNS